MKVDNKLEGLEVLGVFVASTLSLWHVIGFSNVLVTPTSWYLIHLLDDYPFISPNYASSVQHSIKNFSEALPPLGGSTILAVCPCPLFNSGWYL